MGVVVVGIAVRVVLLPAAGHRDDINQFVRWVHEIAIDGVSNAYDHGVSFPPIMVYIWGLLAALDPAFKTVSDGSEVATRVVMKIPAILADLGLAGLAAYALRDRPPWAVAGAALILLHPAVLDVGAWWGQYESVYLVSALAAAVLAINGRNNWAAAALAVSLMTKPQALPFILPFAAWFLATSGWRGLGRATLVGAGVIVVLWLPFVPAGGPLNYVADVGRYQGEVFAILSLRAWNFWWLVQEAAAGGQFVADTAAILGPLTFRHSGYAIAGLLELFVAIAVFRDPRPRTLILGLAASVLVAFSFLTAMHERYAFGALVFLALLIAEPRMRWLNAAFAVVFTANLFVAVPPTPEFAALIPLSGPLDIVGSIAMLAITVAALRELPRASTDRATP